LKISDSTLKNYLAIVKISNKNINNKLGWTGDLLTNEKDIAEEFKNYYIMLLNKTASRPSDATYIQYSTAESCISNPSRPEINWSINKLKNNKAPGESNVVTELLKNSGEALKNEIWKMINLI